MKPRDFAQRVREIGGFSLDNIRRLQQIPHPELPDLVPVFLHGKKRSQGFNAAPVVCVPLYEVIAKNNGEPRFTERRGLVHGFKISPECRVILTGTAIDPPLERWWSLGTQRRRESIESLKQLGIALVTTPNFSLFTDRPRWDDLHSIKRVALVHEELIDAGMPSAVHVNARTDRDWARWQEFLRLRPEITHVAFEFATGAGYGRRIHWHVDHLARLATNVGRPLHLIVRGGIRALPRLSASFSRVTLLETSTFVKTVKRQRAAADTERTLSWVKSPTKEHEMLDELLVKNWETVSQTYVKAFERRVKARA